MPKTTMAYGKSYHPCPCAQVIDYSTNTNDYYACKCCSPQRGGKKIMIKEKEQAKICLGGTVRGKRYTTCPYYVRGVKAQGAGYKKKLGFSLIIRIIPVVFFMLLLIKSVWVSGAQYSKVTALVFAVLTIIFIWSFVGKDDQISSDDKKRKNGKD